MLKVRFAVLTLIAVGFGYVDLLVRPCWAHSNGVPEHEMEHLLQDDPLYNIAQEFINWVTSGGEPPHFVPSGPLPSEDEDSWDTVSYPSPPTDTGGGSFESVFQVQDEDKSSAESIVDQNDGKNELAPQLPCSEADETCN